MRPDLSALFHQLSKNRFRLGNSIPADSSKWPAAWTRIETKDYARLPHVELPHTSPRGDLFNAIHSRASRREFTGAPLPLEKLATILKYSCGETKEGRRAQASGGARYPIEVYPIVFQGSEELPGGVYHYSVDRHALASLWERDFTKEDIAALYTYPWAQDVSVAFVLTAVFDRNQRKYGERGYRQIIIEAGAIVQNMYLVCAALDIQCCAIDGVREHEIEKLIDIDGFTESAVVSVVVGPR